MNRFYFRCVADPWFQYPGIFISDFQEFDVKCFISLLCVFLSESVGS
jgi:hypothetical protein